MLGLNRKSMSSILLLKLFLVPILIFSVTLAGRRWGPRVAGALSAFPVVSGPILLALTLEQGAVFGAAAASGTLLAVSAILVFSLGYSWGSARFGVAGSMLCAFAGYAVAVGALQGMHMPPAASFPLVLSALLLAPRLFPIVPPVPSAPPDAPPNIARQNDLPWRMLAAALLVLTVTWFATRLGPRMSGFMAMFPVMGTVLVGFSHHCSGRPFAVALMRGMVAGYYAFATFCLALALLLPLHGVAVAFSVALGGALLVQLAAMRLARPAA